MRRATTPLPLSPGTYDITVEQSGFSKLTKTGRIVVVDQAQRTDFKLAGRIDGDIGDGFRVIPADCDR